MVMEPDSEGYEAGSPKILCCECGLPTEPNALNICPQCVQSRVDISGGIPRQLQLQYCKECERYLKPPSRWLLAASESKELMAVCLSRLKPALQKEKARLVDASFIWTEPHSKRIKLSVTVQREVLGCGTMVQQKFPVEFVVQNQMCEECHRIEAKDYWRACVQVRQHCPQKKTLYYMEQLILKHQAHSSTTAIKSLPFGMDFFFAKKQDAKRLVGFLTDILPCRSKYAQELVTHDPKNNTYDYKHTFCVELVPLCKNDPVCLSKKVAQQLGNIGQICIVNRVSELVELIDPTSGQMADVSASFYWKTPFESFHNAKNLSEFIVIDTEAADVVSPVGHGRISRKHAVSDIWVMRSEELGQSGADEFCVKSHLGHLLKAGDTVLGIDLTRLNFNDTELEKIPSDKRPDVILIKKSYDKVEARRKRPWHMKRLAQDTETEDGDFQEFLIDLEEDTESESHTSMSAYNYNDISIEKMDCQDEMEETI